MDFDFDVAIIGAGVVGLACGYALAKAGATVVVLESEGAIGQGVSSRNSEVIHAGLYYPTGSHKAKFCVEGRRMLYAFCDSHGVTYKKCGKLVVATRAEHEDRLEAIAEQAQINDVEGMSHLSANQAISLEPELQCLSALLSAESGVVDSHALMLALQGEIESRGGAVVVSTPFEAARALDAGGVEIAFGGVDPGTITCSGMVVSAGLGAQSVAARIEGFNADKIPKAYFGKGVYFRLQGRAPFSHLVYPPPIVGALGTHYRCDLGGQGVFGPDLDYVDTLDYTVDPGRVHSFVDQIKGFWPGVSADKLTPDYAGIRPKIHGKGMPQPDYQILDSLETGVPGVVALFGIESPGLTSSLAIGQYVSDLCTPFLSA